MDWPVPRLIFGRSSYLSVCFSLKWFEWTSNATLRADKIQPTLRSCRQLSWEILVCSAWPQVPVRAVVAVARHTSDDTRHFRITLIKKTLQHIKHQLSYILQNQSKFVKVVTFAPVSLELLWGEGGTSAAWTRSKWMMTGVAPRGVMKL